MDSFKALQFGEHDGQFVSGFVHLDESRPDLCSVTRYNFYSRVVGIGMA